jgi:hypothetical protein
LQKKKLENIINKYVQQNPEVLDTIKKEKKISKEKKEKKESKEKKNLETQD